MNISKKILLIVFFFSGLSGLIYEIAWMRQLTLLFGSTTSAVSTVLTSFFAGLAIGSLYFGKTIDKKIDVLKVYGLLELGIGLYCFATPLIFALAGSVYVSVFQNSQIPFYPHQLIRFVLSFIILIVPTTMMGGTLPVLSRYFISIKEETGRHAGRLYALNTLGAVAGAFITGILLIRTAGIRNTIYIAASINIAVSIITYFLRSSALHPQIGDSTRISDTVKSNRIKKVALIVFALSGFASMAYEVLWSRILIMIIGSSTYAFTVLLIVLLSGIAVGSYVYSKFADRTVRSLMHFCIAEILIGVLAILSIPAFSIMPSLSRTLLSGIRNYIAHPWITYTAVQFILSSFIMFIPAFLMGVTFPLAGRLCADDINKTGNDIGRVYSFNTFGGIAGSFAGGFLLIPLFGTRHSLIMVAFFNLSLGVLLLLYSEKTRPALKAIFSFSCIILFLASSYLIPSWDLRIFTGLTGRVPYGSEKVIFHKEGIGGTVAVTYHEGRKTLFIDGENESSSGYYSLMTQSLLAYLPLFLHEHPEHVLEVGLGGGITLGKTGNYDSLKEIESVEIIGAARDAARLFNRENNSVLSNPKVNIIINDGRNYLLLTDKKYDVITGNTTHPWTAGAANILSREYFSICRDHLKKGGLISQWIPLQFIDPLDVKSIIKTFHSVFPHTSVWFSNMDIILIGSDDKMQIDMKRFNEKIHTGSIQKDLDAIDNASAYALLSRFIMDERRLKEYLEKTSYLITDDRPVLEFRAPVNRHSFTLARNLNELITFRRDSSPVRPYLTRDDQKKEETFTEELDKYYISMTHNMRGIIAENKRNISEAYNEYSKALAVNPDDRTAQRTLAKIITSDGFFELNSGRYDTAVLKFKEALKKYPQFIDARFGLSSIYIREKLLDKAVDELKSIIAIDPNNAKARNNLGGIYGMRGLHDKACLEFKAAIDFDPYYVSSYNNVASYYYVYKKDRKKALPYLKKSLALDPGQKKAEWIREMLNKT